MGLLPFDQVGVVKLTYCEYDRGSENKRALIRVLKIAR